MVSCSRCCLVNSGICKVVFQTLNRSENTGEKCWVFGRCELAQCRSQEAVFKRRISINIQKEFLAFICGSNQEFLEIETELSFLHLKEETPLPHLKFEVVGCI